MDATVHAKVSQVYDWLKREPRDICMIVLKSINDCAIVYEMQDSLLKPTYVEHGVSKECSFLEAAVLSADVIKTEVRFRMPLMAEKLYCVKDANGKYAIMVHEDNTWRRVDILYADLAVPKRAIVTAYGTELDGAHWTRSVEMDLSQWM